MNPAPTALLVIKASKDNPMPKQNARGPKTQPAAKGPATLEEFNTRVNSIIDWGKFWQPPPGMNINQPLDYTTDAVAFAIPIFEALHRLAGNPEADLRQEEPGASPLVSEGRPLAECIRQFGVLCYTLHNLQEQATPNFDSDYNPHQTVVAGSELLRELACLAFQIEPCFSEPEELEAVAKPIMPADLPAIVPITASDFQED